MKIVSVLLYFASGQEVMGAEREKVDGQFKSQLTQYLSSPSLLIIILEFNFNKNNFISQLKFISLNPLPKEIKSADNKYLQYLLTQTNHISGMDIWGDLRRLRPLRY